MIEHMTHSLSSPATLISSTGEQTPVSVELAVRPSQREWGGSGVLAGDQYVEPGDYTLRLPNGQEGQVLVSSVNPGSDGVALTLKGSGRPPSAGN